MANLIWNPLIDYLEDTVGGRLFELIAPYCQLSALKHCVKNLGRPSVVITSWKIPDLAKHIGNLDVYPELKSLGVPLYINSTLHAKLFVFDDQTALCTSGNITSRGLGLSENQNIECGSHVTLDLEDQSSLRQLRDNSIKVDDARYEKFKSELEKFDLSDEEEYDGHDDLYKVEEDAYLISSLPATKSPESFIHTILRSQNLNTPEWQAELHDQCTFNVNPELKEEQLHANLQAAFRAQPFVQDIYAKIKAKKSMSFGAVTEFVQRTCRDVPMPYRRDIKETVNTLYNWLAYFYEELYWDRPNYSQVIYYREP
jgi:phosphatidylserine/phosphatidylglycerophosphate/cardiolipin synthase-like enzyme